MKVIFYNGREYRSVKELCDTLGISASLFRYYNSTKGMSVEDSMERCLFPHKAKRSRRGNEVHYQGKVYESEKALCEAHGADYSSYTNRKRSGKTVEERLSPDKYMGSKTGNEIYYQGKVYESEKALCEAQGVSYNTYAKRKSRGKTLEECLYPDNGRKIKRGKEVCYQGKVYRSMQELCDAYGIKENMFRYYNNEKGMSVKDSIERCIHPIHKGNHITYNGITYSSESEMCRRLGVNHNSYIKRKSEGKPLEECLFPDKSKRSRKGKEVCYQGKVYRSMKELCEARGVSYGTYSTRRQRGKTLEECISSNKHKGSSKGNKIYYQGRVYESEKALCRAKGVNYDTYRTRRQGGRTLEECLSSGKYSRAGNEVCYQGKVYESEKALCEAQGMKYSTYMARRKRGYTIEESLKPVNSGTSKGSM